MDPPPLHRQKSFWLGLLLAIAALVVFELLMPSRRVPPVLQSLELRTKIKNSFDAEWRRSGESARPNLGPLGLGGPGEPLKFVVTGADAATLEKVKPVLARALSHHQAESATLSAFVERGDGFVNAVEEVVKARP